MVGVTPEDGERLHLDPIAYLIGLQGVALMRAFAGEHDAVFVEDRVAEVGRLIADRARLGPVVDVSTVAGDRGYDAWSPSYDDPGNGLLAPDFDRVTAMLEGHPGGRALDAACGTGRYAEWLSAQGYEVLGVDRSEGMLAVARAKLPGLDLRTGDLRDLPVESDTIDVAVCALALTHVEHLEGPYRELVRVLRPGGRLVVSDTHSLFLGSGRYPLVRALPDGSFGVLSGWEHSLADHVSAALAAGLEVTAVAELTGDELVDPSSEPARLTDQAVPDPWALMTWAPAATNAAYAGSPRATYLQLHRR